MVRPLKPEEELPDAVLAGLPRRFRLNPENVLVAEDATGRIVGMVGLLDGGHDLLHVFHFQVDPAARGRTVGIELIQGVIALARQRGVMMVSGLVVEGSKIHRRHVMAGSYVDHRLYRWVSFLLVKGEPNYGRARMSSPVVPPRP